MHPTGKRPPDTKRGLSQHQLAVPAVGYAYISRIENGDREPSVKVMRKLARQAGAVDDPRGQE